MVSVLLASSLGGCGAGRPFAFAPVFAGPAPASPSPPLFPPAPSPPAATTMEPRPSLLLSADALWLAENWTVERWERFQRSGLSRQAFIAEENRESLVVSIAEGILGTATVGGLFFGASAMGMDERDFGGPVLGAGVLAGVALAAVVVSDVLANRDDMVYLGELTPVMEVGVR